MSHVIGISYQLCKCGCGGFTSMWDTGNASDYINGHQCRLGAAGRVSKVKIDCSNNDIFKNIKRKTKKEIVYFIFDNRCYACHCDDQILHMHHILPISEGGSDEIDNLILLCPSCHTVVHAGTELKDDDLFNKRFKRYSDRSALPSSFDQCHPPLSD